MTLPRFLTEAAHGSLKPPPTRRLRRVLLHLSYSMALSRLLDTTPPRLLTAAACGGLRPAPDRRPRRAFLHLLYSCACRLDRQCSSRKTHSGHSDRAVPPLNTV